MTTSYLLVNIRNAIFRRQAFPVAVMFLLVCCEQFFGNFLVLILTGHSSSNNSGSPGWHSPWEGTQMTYCYADSVNGWHQTGLHPVLRWCCASPAEEDTHRLMGTNRANTRHLFPNIKWALLRISSRLVPKGSLHPFPGVLDFLYRCRPRVQHTHTRFIVSWKRHIFWHRRTYRKPSTDTYRKHAASVPAAWRCRDLSNTWQKGE